MRTGLGFIALGIAIERFSQLDLGELLSQLSPAPLVSSQAQQQRQEARSSNKQQSELLVGTLLGTGSGSIVYGTSRYFVNLRMLERGLFKPAYHGPAVLSIGVAGLAGAVYYSTMRGKEGVGRA